MTIQEKNNEDEYSEDTTYIQVWRKHIRTGLFRKLKSTDVKVLFAIAIHIDKQGQCFPSQETIASLCGICRSAVQASIKKLEKITIDKEPLIKKYRTPPKRRGQFSNNTYKINSSFISFGKTPQTTSSIKTNGSVNNRRNRKCNNEFHSIEDILRKQQDHD